MRYIDININDDKQLEAIGDSLSSPYRRKILKLLINDSYTANQLAEILDLATSTISFHLKILKEAGLIKEIPSPSKKGNEKNISLDTVILTIRMADKIKEESETYFQEIPIGSFSNYQIDGLCAMNTIDHSINPFDNPIIFKSPERIEAKQISFSKGFLEYTILKHKFKNSEICSITFSLECCSECPNYNNNWKSDISFWLNDVEIGTLHSQGDYGGRRGKYTPEWWPLSSSQYGLLTTISINDEGSYINGNKISDISLKDLNLDNNDFISFKIGIKDNAKFKGGVNIFGKGFGDYPQDIEMTVNYKKK